MQEPHHRFRTTSGGSGGVKVTGGVNPFTFAAVARVALTTAKASWTVRAIAGALASTLAGTLAGALVGTVTPVAWAAGPGTATAAAALAGAAPVSQNQTGGIDLHFRPDGTFTIVQFSDPQDNESVNPRTLALMEQVLDTERPDLVVLTGDNISGSECKDAALALRKIVAPMEQRHIPYAVVFGNHDDEGRLARAQLMKVLQEGAYNLSQSGPTNLPGVGNYYLLVHRHDGSEPVVALYFLDSGAYAPKAVGGYDWIKPAQIDWYRETATSFKAQLGHVLPALMFFHIPLPEFDTVWQNGTAIGSKNEDVCAPKFNSGLFAAMVEVGDVKGVFVGHDHVNDYIGELNGIRLAYGGSVGYDTYGKQGFPRRARVIRLREDNPANFETWIHLPPDHGLDPSW
ncbi:MAG: metallophosphoesterase family protein [Limnochordaceae bacterium]|nr:metallophosphoesterase family protein [Limnochordaceae bacterium]